MGHWLAAEGPSIVLQQEAGFHQRCLRVSAAIAPACSFDQPLEQCEAGFGCLAQALEPPDCFLGELGHCRSLSGHAQKVRQYSELLLVAQLTAYD
jgi:hypothetical protein